MSSKQLPASDRRLETRHEVYVDVMASFGSHVDHQAVSRNISRGGLFVSTHNVVPEGFEVDLRFQLPGSARPIYASGTVCWTQDTGRRDVGAVSGFGVQFERLSDEAREQIEHFVNRRDRDERDHMTPGMSTRIRFPVLSD